MPVDKDLLEPSSLKAVTAYCQFFEALSPETIDHIDRVASPDIRFKDPFNDIKGRDTLKALFAHMFENVSQAQFEVMDRAPGREYWFLYWRFSGVVPALGGDWSFDGTSRIQIGEDGLVCEHVDYWDAAEHFFGKIRIIGPTLRWIGRRGQAV